MGPIYKDIAEQIVFMNIAYAQGGSLNQIENINNLVVRLASLGDVVVYLLVSLAVVYIVWSVVQYFIKGKEGDESRKEAGLRILWGLVGLFVIVSLWGLVNILVRTFSTDANVPRDRFPSADFVNK